ncbi:Presenilin-domain-containing protein [Syncephalis fuscata]|nr:Presenilin-domain-containing protein [Syncephalis fuscata]
MCARCGPSVKYCSESCQTQDWPTHQTVCGINNEKHNFTGGYDTDMATLSDIETVRSRPMSRYSAAQVINQRRNSVHQTQLRESTILQPNGEEDEDEMTQEEKADELRFYVKQIYLIVKPVLGCVLLSILWVKLSILSNYKPAGSAGQVYTEANATSGTSRFFGSLANAAIILSQIIVMTIVIFVLYKYGCFKILFGFFMVVVALLLGGMGLLLEMSILDVLSIPMDYFTLSFGLYNFAVVGVVMVMWSKGPIRVQQAYLTIMSSLMAFSLTGLAEWTTWLLLGLLAIWDLIAVLCPFGPLKMLIESTKNQSKPVPALLYAVNAVWLMAFNERDYVSETDYQSTHTAVPNYAIASPHLPSAMDSHVEHIAMESRVDMAWSKEPAMSSAQGMSNHTPHPLCQSTSGSVRNSSRPGRNEPMENEEIDEEVEEAGIKLGLGDFVFYSVLIARAAMLDWITTVACTVAVMMGLNATIFLLAIRRKALPALPISIAFGILFYFVSSIMLVPCLEALSIAQVFL